MSHYFLTQTAKCIVASAVDFIRRGRPIPGVKIEGLWDAVLGGQQPHDAGIAATPRTVELLNSMSLEARTAVLLNLFQADPQYACARHFTDRTVIQFPITLAVYVESAWRERITKSW